MPLLETHALTKRYGATLALDRLELALPDGGIFGFLGPNGSGKTTTIRLLLGLLHPTSGQARIFGLDCWRQSARIKRELGYLPGDLRLYPAMNGAQLLKLCGRIRGMELTRPGRELAERFDFNLARKVSAMSRGTQQKLGLILALAHAPRMVILDEPTNGLDPIMQNRLKEHLHELAAGGRTIFFSSHSLSTVEQLCDRVAILRRGRLVIDTTLDDLRAQAWREVRITWRGGHEPAQGPDGLEVVDRAEGEWLCRWRGAVEPLVGWIASGKAPPIDDLTISPPDLENLFHEYYAYHEDAEKS